MSKKPTTSKIDGITTAETQLLQAMLLFVRNIKPYEIGEIKLKDNQMGCITFQVKTNHRETFDM